jgi:hypothetical protein
VAENCNDDPAGSVGLPGVTAIDTSVDAAPTVTVVEPHTVPAHAFTVAAPAARA